MKFIHSKPVFIAILTCIIFAACNKEADNPDMLSNTDVTATAVITSELSIMQQSVNNLSAATNLISRHH